MAKVVGLQTNFTAGETTPLLGARIDFEKYKNSLFFCENFLTTPHGPAIRRQGSVYIDATIDSNYTSRLIPFRVSDNDSVVIELTQNKMTFLTFDNDGNLGRIESGGLPVEVTTTYTEDQLPTIQFAQVGSEMHLVHPDHHPKVLKRVSLTSWLFSDTQLSPEPTAEIGFIGTDTLSLAATTGTGITVTASTSSFLATDVGRTLVNLSGVGVATIMSYVSGTQVTVDFTVDFDSSSLAAGEWKIGLSPVTTMTPSAAAVGQVITLTGSGNCWRTSDVGNYVEISGGVVQILSYTSATVVRGIVLSSLSTTTGTLNWVLVSPIWNSTNGYPRCVAFHQQRLVYASSEAYPLTVWASESDDITSFAVTSTDASALNLDLQFEGNSLINSIISARDLIIIGDSGEGSLGGAQGAGLTATNATFVKRSTYGGRARMPISAAGKVVFIQGGGKKLPAYGYDFSTDTYRGEDLLFLAEHLGYDGLNEIAYAEDPVQRIWACDDAGAMIVGNYDPTQSVMGWSRVNVGGLVKSLCTLPNNGAHYLIMVVERTIDGSTVQYIETISPLNDTDDRVPFQDCSLLYSVPKTITNISSANPGVVTSASHGFANGDKIVIKDVVGMTEVNGKKYTVANTTSNTFQLSGLDTSGFVGYTSGGKVYKRVTAITGLDHLEGEEVSIRGDGAEQASKTVSTGAITLDTAAGEVVIGLPMTSTMTTQRYEAGGGQLQGQRTRWSNIVLRVYNSAHPDVEGLSVPIRVPDDYMDSPPGLSTGDLSYGGSTWGNTGRLQITIDSPMPLTLLGIFGTAEGNPR